MKIDNLVSNPASKWFSSTFDSGKDRVSWMKNQVGYLDCVINDYKENMKFRVLKPSTAI